MHETTRMSHKVSNLIRNFSYTLTSNLISMLVTTVLVLVMPKLIGVREYGYWQLYLFYTGFVGFLHFGWNDGIYLRYGGKEYKELDKGVFFSQFYMLLIFQLAIAILMFYISFLFVADQNKIIILYSTAFCILINNTRGMLSYILQLTNRIREYATIIIIDRLLYLVLIVAFLIIGIKEFRMLIMVDLICKFMALLYATYCCKEIVYQKLSLLCYNFKEALENIDVGIKLMFANIASTLIIGVVRFGIERSWDVSTFGKVSLTFSISNFMMLFINAVGIIMFPILRRTDIKKLPSIYKTMRTFLMVPLLGILMLYYPFKVILSAWLPKYADSLIYMALLFPMCIFEGKMALLINTYLKTLRKERFMLFINLLLLIISIGISIVTTSIFKNLDLAVVSIVILLAFRCVLAEVFLSRLLGISTLKDIVLELSMTSAFILSGWYMKSWIAVGTYVSAYAVYLIIKRNDITSTARDLKSLMRA